VAKGEFQRMCETGRIMKLELAQAIGQLFVDWIAPHCEWVRVAGSVRRGCEEVKDIEIVVTPKATLMSFLDQAVERGEISKALYGQQQRPRWGSKYRGLMFSGARIELFTCDDDNRGWIYYLRTGPGDLNKQLMGKIKHQSPYRLDGGYIWYGTQRLSVPTEDAFFAILGIDPIEPGNRSAEQYRIAFGHGNPDHFWGNPQDFIPDYARQSTDTSVVHFKSVAHLWNPVAQYFIRDDYIYIGRANPTHSLPASKWANPWRVGEDGTREEVLRWYRNRVMDSDLIDQVQELQGKTLVCWCAPLPCHGDILMELMGPMMQINLWDLNTMLELEDAHLASGAPKKKKAPPEFIWPTYWQPQPGLVWIYTGYGQWEAANINSARAMVWHRIYQNNQDRFANDWNRLQLWLGHHS
jgi:hypothetical protein